MPENRAVATDPQGMTPKTGRFFEDFRLGETLVHATPRTVTEGDASLYIALTGARHPLYCAAPAARQFGFRQQPLDDLLAFHIAFGKTVPDISVNAVANLGYADVQFLAPVYPGDTLTTQSEVIGLKQNSNGRTGIVYVLSRAHNQVQQPVLSWVRWVMVRKHDTAAPAPTPVIPDLPREVPPAALPGLDELDGSRFDPLLTGSDRRWEDYSPGERINHPAGMTIDPSDHTLATKLYQNTARVHFDQLAMQDSPMRQRLVYGGHVISICRALSYDGLENALLIRAINGGTHVNPTFAGDTIYCWSEILERWALPGRTDLGALRLRLVGLKNCPPSALASSHQGQTTDGGYHDAVVLDLDYSVIMPRHQ